MRSAIYRRLVALHPPEFMRQFGQEMESIFDESGQPSHLLWDIVISLGRQWLLRKSYLWTVALAAAGGLIPFALGFYFLSVTRSHFGITSTYRTPLRMASANAVSQPITKEFVMMTAVIALLFISSTIAFAITWFRYSQRRRV